MPTVAPHLGTGRWAAELRPGAKVVLSHPGTGPFVQHAARALHEAGLLAAYVTTFHYDRNTVLGRILRRMLGLVMRDSDRQLGRREITEIPRELIRSHPVPEMIRMAAVKAANEITTDRVWEVTEKWFDRMVARQHVRGTTAAYAYEHAALATFEAQRRQGGKCIYEMPITHHTTTATCLDEGSRDIPPVQSARDVHLRKVASRRNKRRDGELAGSDCRLSVLHSPFTTLRLVPRSGGRRWSAGIETRWHSRLRLPDRCERMNARAGSDQRPSISSSTTVLQV